MLPRRAARRTWAFGALFGLTTACNSAGAPPMEPDGGGGVPPYVTEHFSVEQAAVLQALVLEDQGLADDPTNAYAEDPKAAELGQRLFFDTSFSGALISEDNDGRGGTLGQVRDTGKVACSSCHVPESHFTDTRTFGQKISLAADWVLRRTPSILDVGQVPRLMWDGRHDSLFRQAVAPVETMEEMNSSRLFLAHRIATAYRAEYEAVFGPMGDLGPSFTDPQRTGCWQDSGGEVECHGMPGDGAEYDALTPEQQRAVTQVAVNFGKAIAAYELRLTCGPSRFDAWMKGEGSALSDPQIRGLQLFVGKADCVRCHSGPYFSDHDFHNVGLRPETVTNFLIDDNDRGAIEGLSQLAQDPLNVLSDFSDDGTVADGRVSEAPTGSHLEGAFRTPMLRCSTARPSFMHTGHLTSLAAVVWFFSQGGDEDGYPGASEIDPLDLTAQEQEDLVAFLKSLDGPGPKAKWLQAP